MRNRKSKKHKFTTKKALVAVATAAMVAGTEIMGSETSKHVQLKQAEQPATLTYWINGTSTAVPLIGLSDFLSSGPI